MASTSPTAPTTSGKAPTENMAAAMAAASIRLGHLTRSTVDELDRLHGAGLAVPDKVREAVETLVSFGVALSCNAQGQPTPPEFRAALGLT